MEGFETYTLRILFAIVLTTTISFAIPVPYDSDFKESIYEHYDPFGNTHGKGGFMHLSKNSRLWEKNFNFNNNEINALETANNINKLHKEETKLYNLDKHNLTRINRNLMYLLQCVHGKIIHEKNEKNDIVNLKRNEINIPAMIKIQLSEYNRYYDIRNKPFVMPLINPEHTMKNHFIDDWIKINKEHTSPNDIYKHLGKCILNLLNIRKSEISFKEDIYPLSRTNLLKRELDPLGGANLLRRELDPLGGANLLKRELDPLGGANLLRRELDPLGGANLLKRELDPLGGANLLRRELDSLGGANLLKRELDPLGGANLLRRELDPLGGANLLKRELDPLGGANLLRRELDPLGGANLLRRELDPLGGANLLKRELDPLGGANLLRRELDPLGGANLLKRELDPLGGANLLRRELDLLNGLNLLKRELDPLGGANLLKRKSNSLDGSNILKRKQNL